MTARDARGNSHFNILHVDDLDVVGSRKEEVTPRLGVTSPSNSLATATYSAEWDPTMMETSVPGGSLVVPRATTATAASRVAAATASAVVALGAASSPTAAHDHGVLALSMEGLPLGSQGGEARRSANFLAEDTADEEDKLHQRDGGSAPVLDVCSLLNAGNFSVGSLDPGHQVLVTPPRVVRIPLAASRALQAVHDADGGHARSVAMPSFTAHPSPPLLPAAPTVAPLPPPLPQELGSLLPRLSSADTLGLASGRLTMREPSIAAIALHGRFTVPANSHFSAQVDYPNPESECDDTTPRHPELRSSSCSSEGNSSSCT